MDREAVYKEAVEILQEEGHDASYRSDYSGRGMYGESVPGIVTGASLAEVGWAVTYASSLLSIGPGEENHVHPDVVRDALEFVPKNSDSMGLDKIYY